jgi:importin-7
MFNCNSRAINKQYVRSIITICRFDYPEKWPSLVQDIANALNSGNDKGILTGCIALFCLAKKYEYELDEAREPLFKIMEDVNGILG